ncbi:2-isopropylmalate synthase [Williamsia sp.]|uniref:2-isopropylmalate synthase n=1 Tax=Williamsia sp. TaxID=1872085 RepID=UPI002F929AAC
MNTLISTDSISSDSQHQHQDRFTARLGRPLPTALHAEAAGMSWSTFTSTFAPTSGPIRLGSWTSDRGPDDLLFCRATIADGDTISALTATASGPIGALTDMLYQLGAGLEIISIHQYDHAGAVVIFLRCNRDGRQTWAMGTGTNSEDSSLGALIAAANRLS